MSRAGCAQTFQTTFYMAARSKISALPFTILCPNIPNLAEQSNRPLPMPADKNPDTHRRLKQDGGFCLYLYLSFVPVGNDGINDCARTLTTTLPAVMTVVAANRLPP